MFDQGMVTEPTIVSQVGWPGSPARVNTAMLAAAAAGGALYAFSPLSVIFAVGMALLLVYAVRGLSSEERQTVLGVLVISLALRLAAVVLLYVMTDPAHEDFKALFGDGRFSIARSIWMMKQWQGVPIGPFYRFWIYASYGVTGYDRCLAVLQWFIGPSPHALVLISITAFYGGTVVLYRMARWAFGQSAAIGGLVVLVFWPTFFVWSISMLKESVELLLSAVAIAAARHIVRPRGPKFRVALACAGASGVYLAGIIRTAGDLILIAAILFGYAVFNGARRSAVFVTLAAVIVVGGSLAASRPAVQARIQAGVSTALHYHLGHVMSIGKGYHAADQHFYAEWPGSRFAPVSFEEGARFLLKSAAMFVLVPLPLHVVSANELVFLPELYAWYLIVAFACAGAWLGLRRDPLLTGLFVGYCLAGAAIIAPNSGNIGTLIRHRDMIVPFTVWLSGLGAVGALSTLTRKRYASD